jgi:nicotinamide mononucleotide adenylyltransferase
VKVAILGRFQPLHNGHVSFINNYLKDDLCIGLCASNITNVSNPFSANDRIKMLNIVYPSVNVIQIPDFNMLEEGKDGKMWRDFICVLFDGYDKIVSGNPWVIDLLKDYFEIEKPKALYQVSGSLVRNYMLSGLNWKGLVPHEVYCFIKNNSLVESYKTLTG